MAQQLLRHLFIEKLVKYMKEILESFNNFRKIVEKTGDTTQLKVDILLVIDRNVDRYKEDVLSDIRAVPGVTIIKVLQHTNKKNLDYNVITMKFDTDSLDNNSVIKSLLFIRKKVMAVDSVVKMKYLTRPERYA